MEAEMCAVMSVVLAASWLAAFAAQRCEPPPAPRISVKTEGFQKGTFLIVDIFLTELALQKIEPHKKAIVKRLESGTLLPYTGSIADLWQQCINTFATAKALITSAKLELELVEVSKQDGTGNELVLSDEALRTVISQIDGVPRAKVTLTCVAGSRHTKRALSCKAADEDKMKGKNTSDAKWLSNYVEKLQGFCNDYWRGMLQIVDTKRVRCLCCGEILHEINGRPLDQSRLETHLHQHAKSNEAKNAAKETPSSLPSEPNPEDIPHILSDTQLAAVKKQPLNKDLFLACLGKVYDLWNPWRAGLETKGYSEASGLLPVLLCASKSTNQEKALQQKARGIRPARLKLQREAAAQRKVDAAEEKLEKEKEKAKLAESKKRKVDKSEETPEKASQADKKRKVAK